MIYRSKKQIKLKNVNTQKLKKSQNIIHSSLYSIKWLHDYCAITEQMPYEIR
jgi:hypothetical protein